ELIVAPTLGDEARDRLGDVVAARDPERAALAERRLHVDDEQRAADGGALGRFHGASHSRRVPPPLSPISAASARRPARRGPQRRARAGTPSTAPPARAPRPRHPPQP